MNLTNMGKALALLRNMLNTTKRTLSPLPFEAQKPLFIPCENKYFERVTPEECGIDSKTVSDYVKELYDDPNVSLRDIMLLRNGKVFFECSIGDCDINVWQSTFSECKSVVSLAIGKLVTDNKISLTDRVIDFFPDKTPPVAKIKLKRLQIKHLLTMTSTVSFNELESSVTQDWVKGFLSSSTDGEIGKTFAYNSLNTYMLSAIVKQVTGMGLSQYLDSTIFKALGIKNYYWEKCPMGIEKGGWGLFILPEDIAKLGVLVQNGGTWNGKRIIKKSYIKDAVSQHAEAPEDFGNYNYGYQIWKGRDADSFLFNGMLGQNLLCWKDNGIMIVANCGNGYGFHQSSFFPISEKYFQKSFLDTLPENKKAFKELQSTKEMLSSVDRKQEKLFLSSSIYRESVDTDIKTLDGIKLTAESPNALSTGLFPLFLQAVTNNFTRGLVSVSFEVKENRLFVSFEEEDGTYEIPVGFSKPERHTLSYKGDFWTVSSSGVFSENEDGVQVFKLTVNFVETPYKRICKFFFTDRKVVGDFTESPGYQFATVATETMFEQFSKNQFISNVYSKLDSDFLSVKLEKAFSKKLLFGISRKEK